MLSPSASASERRLRTTSPHPSPRPYPSAAASKVLQRPSAANIPALEKVRLNSGANIRFTPHVVPCERGILVTAYGVLTKKLSRKDILAVYNKYYSRKHFIRIFKDKLPQLKDVVDTNFCDIGVASYGSEIVVVGAIDNLIKGASGQAIQNMNIRMGYDERTGLL